VQAGLQLVHTLSAVPEQACDWNLPAGQLVHARHSRSLVAVHAMDS
jgi:hypothetical protein